ncbi:MAG: amino acid adenylation domain-containing protein, partial [Longimicrobiaceae bacterium]
PGLVVGVLGILQAGGAYLPLDPSHPDERLLFMLRDAGAAAVVTDPEMAARIAGFGGAVVGATPHPPTPSPTRGEGENYSAEFEGQEALPQNWGRVASLSEPGGGPEDASGISIDPDNLAYVVYTSGSTGTPKGVLVTHRGLANYLAFFDREILGDDGFALPLVSRLSFDAHVRQLFPPLLRGEPVWVLPEDAVADPVALLDALGSRGRVSFGGVPSLWGAVMDAIEAGERPAPHDLRAVLLGGEALPAELVRRTLERFPGVRIWNHYGPTEATVNTTVARVEDADRVTLGRPIANARVYLLDAHGGPVPTGVAGELHVGGAGVSRGYLGRPELTAEKFVPDPFSAETGARMYRSGDRARWLPTGELEYLGRTDQQVKVRGFRVEPGEIEAALRRHPAVRDAVVDARGDGRGGLRLVAYVVPAAGLAASPAELRAHLAGELPEYMVPAAFAALDALPLSANGKLDRAALPNPEAADAAGERAAPRTATEEILAGIWGVVLQREQVGAGDDFFGLGGHSLAATSMISRVRRAFGVEVPLRAVFEAPTLAALAGRVDALLREGAGMTLPPLVRVPRDGPLPLSFAQRRLWFIDRLHPDAPLYDLAFAFRLRGALDPRALRRAVGETVRRHEVLRTRFEDVGGEPVQVVDPPAPVPLPRVDLSSLAAEAAEREARRLAEGEVRFRFDLRRGPLLRTTLLRLADRDWALLLTVHHIVFDGWSTGVFNTELSALYGAFAAGRPSPLPEPAFQYADYAAWQRGWLAGEVLERQLAWWRASLAGAPPLLELPTDFPRPAIPGTRAARLHFAVPAGATRGLHALARAEGATLFMALLAAWQLLLSRYAGQDDVVVGAPIAGRRRTEMEPLVGYFVNTLALRGDLSGDPTVGELLRRVREATLGAYQHQDLPFERLVEELGVERSLGHSPVFQTLFAVQNHQRTAMRLEGLRLEPFPTEEDAARTDLGLTLVEGGDRLLGVLTFRTDLWEAATMERMLGHFTRLLDEAAAGSGRRLSELRLMGAAEREQLLVAWNAASRGAPHRCVHELFAEQAARTPDAVAVSSATDSLTYAELALRADAVARELRERGVGPDAPVGVCVERSPEMVAAVLGVLRAGGAFLPLDPEYPAERLAFMLEDSGARVLLTDGAAGDRLADFGGEVVALDPSLARGRTRGHDGSAADTAVAGCSLFPVPCSLSLAYVIYTSGSTGTPKGVAVPHGALAGTLLAAGAAFGLGAGDVMASLASFAFDIWLLEALLPLISGGSVRMVPRERVVDVDALVEELEGATHLHAVPALMRRVVDRVAAGRGTLPALRSALVGGDAVPPELPAAMREVFPAAAVRVLYGPTEGAIICAAHRARGGEARGRYLLGGPLGNAPLYVLDAAGEPAPVGVPGELCIGGSGTARGYVGAAGPTAARFVPDPFAAQHTAGARMYRSGDRVRWLPDGTLEFLGRLDGQVKVRGFRIEPGEIRARLTAHPAVRDAAVLVREDTPGERRLVAYVVPSGGGASPAELREHLRARLPEPMVPAAVVVLDELPLTRNGKVDRAALPAPERAGGAREWTPPRTPAEEVLAGIWAEVLGVERVGADDDFFALGGHSLLATQVASRVRAALGAELPLRALFEAPTLADLARRIDRLRTDAPAGGGAPPLVPAARGDAPLPLSFAQQRLWILDRLEPGGSAYNMPLALRLRGPLDARALARAAGGVARRHEALRTTFGDDGGTPFQVVHAAGIAAPGVADLSGLAPAAREPEAGRRVEECARRPFDLRRGPLLRVHLLRLAAEEHVLVLAMHHVVSDGWSVGVMLRELSALYGAHVAGAPSPLPALPVQYADFAVWQRGWLAGEVLERELAWWRAALAGAPAALELPTDHPRPPLPGARAASAVRVLPRETAEAVRALARREGATTFMVLLAALDVLLARWSGEDDVVVGTPVANRTRRETEDLVGFFANTLVLRVDASGSPAFRGLLARVREATLGAYQHQDVPFERLVDALGVERATGRTPLFQVMFSADDGAGAPRPFGGLRVEHHPTGTPAAKFDLAVSVSEGPAGLGVRFAYREELWDAATVERVAEAYALLLEAAAADPSRRILDLPLLGAAERERVLREWSPGPAAPPPPRAVHEMVAEQALRTPDAAAVTYGGRALTYAALEALAAALAARLRARPEQETTRGVVRAGLDELAGWFEPELVLQQRLVREVPVVGARRLQLYSQAERAIAASL